MSLPTLSVICTSYKRNYLEQQLPRILNQTWKPTDLIVWQNENHLDVSSVCQKYGADLVHSSRNFKFHGRFTVPLLLNTDYVAIFDDDTMPNPGWLEHCLKTHEEYGCVVGANGRNYRQRRPIGLCDGVTNEEPIRADVVGHCWFFPRHWIQGFWNHQVHTFENGEDIHLCATAYITYNALAYVPSQPRDNQHVWGDVTPGIGDTPCAQHKNKDHKSVRDDLHEHWIKQGWDVQ